MDSKVVVEKYSIIRRGKIEKEHTNGNLTSFAKLGPNIGESGISSSRPIHHYIFEDE